IHQVHTASEEQERGIQHVGTAIIQLEQVTQKTASNAEEGASAAEELHAHSETLRAVAGRLAAMVGARS
ncbi:MAG: hypothetical protein JST16_07645, partial [Bdellovibrionales bacterium]|nr:hypothetical protein [Bdellovibrionales bacterium]